MTIGALSGFRVAVTADRRREEQAELLERRGATVLSGPVIRTLPLAHGAAATDATRALLDEPPDVVVLATALGVRGWFSAAEGAGLDDALRDALHGAEVLTRGPKAAGAATTAGLCVTWNAPEATLAEVVDELAQRYARTGPARVAVQLDGADGSPLADRIAALGHDVVAVPVYRWGLPADTGPALRLIAAVADRSVDAVTFTSAHSVTNFCHLAGEAGRADAVRAACSSGDVTVVAVGPVTAARAEQAGLGVAVQPRHPRLGAMVQAAARAFGARTTAFDLAGQTVLVQGRLVTLGDDRPVELTDRERALLAALADPPGIVVSKQALLRRVWPGDADEHVVEVTVGRLRRRLGPAGAGIETVTRRGYRLSPT